MEKVRDRSAFALLFGSRQFFATSMIESARLEVAARLEAMGHTVLVSPPELTRHGAVDSPAEGKAYAQWLRKHDGEFDGIIVSLPNFGDENGVVEALRNARVPILVHAYPDDLERMSLDYRRDSFCGKISIMDVLRQHGIPFTALKPHTVSPQSPRFAQNIDYFGRVCRVASGMRNLRVGAIGARTSAFKTVRIDELALQKHDITVETFDLSYVFHLMSQMQESEDAYQQKAEDLRSYTDFSSTPAASFDKLTRLSAVVDRLVDENELDAIALRCWLEMQEVVGISPCVLLSEMNNRGRVAACEVDLGNAVAMTALSLASGEGVACLDWNNNYGEDDDKCILFHCGPVPQSMMIEEGHVTTHCMLDTEARVKGSFGCNTGRIRPMPFTFASMVTEDGGLNFYVGEGRFTEDQIPAEYFGCAGVAEIPCLQDVLLHIGEFGHRHHVSVTPGNVAAPLVHFLSRYLGCEAVTPQPCL